MNNITATGGLDLRRLKYMELGEQDVQRFTVRPGDVLFNRTNSADLVGKSAIVRIEGPFAYAGYLVRLRVDPTVSDPEYLAAFLNLASTKRRLRAMGKSIVGMSNINATEIQAMSLPVPPLGLQHQFAGLIRSANASFSLKVEADSRANELFASLQHRAFRGEL